MFQRYQKNLKKYMMLEILNEQYPNFKTMLEILNELSKIYVRVKLG